MDKLALEFILMVAEILMGILFILNKDTFMFKTPVGEFIIKKTPTKVTICY